MMHGLLIGIDIGTTGVKVVLVDPERGVIAQTSRANNLWSPRPGWAEVDPEQWRENVLSALAEVVVAAHGAPVAAIATTGMVPAVVFVGHDGEPLRRAILQNDARAATQVQALAASSAGAGALATTGSVPSQQSVAPKALWLAEREPEVWQRTRHIVGSYDWVLSTLGAPPHVEGNWALESGLYGIDGEAFGPMVDAVPGLGERLAPVRQSGDVIGGLSSRVADLVGLPSGTPLVVGGADHVLSTYSAGLGEPGDWLIKLGGAGDILAVSASPVVDERFFLDAHTIPGLWLPNGCMATSGSLVRWARALLQAEDLAVMDAEAAKRRAAEVLCLPYFLGEKSPINDPDLRGVFAGMHLGHDAVDLYRSTLEGIAFGFRHNAEVLRSRGVALVSASVTNGGATSLFWKQIHASVLNVPLRTVRDHPGASLGAAFVGGVGAGVFTEWLEPLSLVKEGETVEPQPEIVDRYEEAYGLWRELAGATAPTMRALARR